MSRIPGAQPPIESTPVCQTTPSTTSAGWTAINRITDMSLRKLGPIRALRTLLRMNQADGFDCPGCAWPDPVGHRTPFEFCENGAKAITEEASPERCGPAFFAKHTISELLTWSDYELSQAGRLTSPMIRKGDTYEAITWEQAFATIADELNGLDDPNEAIFYTSGRTSNEAAFLYQLFVRRFGTNNLPDCSNLCHESSGKGLGASVGSGKGSVTLEDFPKADLIFVIGQNPATNHPRMLTTLAEAHRAGSRIVTVNPIKEAGLTSFQHPQELSALLGKKTKITDTWVPVRINGDVAFLQGVAKGVFELEDAKPGAVLDHNFIEQYCHGFDEYAAGIRAADWAELEASSGISKSQMQELAHAYVASNGTIICWAMGITQHENAVANVREIVNLLLLRGDVGKPGAGPCPVRGHSNVQGDRTMGIWEAPPQAFLDNLGKRFGFTPPTEHGVAAVEAIDAMLDGRGKVFFAMGGNFLSASPDTEATARALENTQMTVQVSTKLNRSHLITGKKAIILPCLGRTEEHIEATGPQFVTVENSQGFVHASHGRLTPASQLLKSEVRIVAELAEATFGTEWEWTRWASNHDLIRDHIQKVIPGFDDYNLRVRAGGFLLRHPNRHREFPTATGKANFAVNTVPDTSLPAGKLHMMTVRSHDQYNTTIYGHDDRYRGVSGNRRIVLMNPTDMADRELEPGDKVSITSFWKDGERKIEDFRAVPFDLPVGNCCTYFPEANPLVPRGQVAELSLTPASKSVVVEVGRS